MVSFLKIPPLHVSFVYLMKKECFNCRSTYPPPPQPPDPPLRTRRLIVLLLLLLLLRHHMVDLGCPIEVGGGGVGVGMRIRVNW